MGKGDTDAFLASLIATREPQKPPGRSAPVNPPMFQPQQPPQPPQPLQPQFAQQPPQMPQPNALFQFSNDPLSKLNEKCRIRSGEILNRLAVATAEKFEMLQKECFQLQALMSALDRCESPIEKLFLGAFAELPEVDFSAEENGFVWKNCVLKSQVEVLEGKYRLDFEIVSKNDDWLAIECDGWESHGNKDSFEADRVRDRILLQSGWLVVRFSGSELFRNAEICAKWVFDYVNSLDPACDG